MLLTRSLLPRIQGKNLLIFDFDGTIADTSPLHEAAFKIVLLPLGVIVLYPAIAGMRTAEAMVHCLTNCGVNLQKHELDNLMSAKQRLVREMMQYQLHPMPGVDRFLEWARKHYRLSMATSGSRNTVELALAKLGYSDWFDPLVCAEDVERAKPHPDAFQKVLMLTGCPPEAALIFEDSDAGLVAARAAGVSCVHVNAESWNRFMEDLE